MRMFLFLLASLAVWACKPAQPDGTPAADTDFKPTGTMSDLVYNPIRPDGTIDSSYLPIFVWQDTAFNFGEVKEGEVITHDFHFRNTGTAPLLITNASSTCGCTIPEYPKTPIQPDSAGVVQVAFNTLNRTGAQTKEVTIFANTIPNQTILTLTGRVEPSKK
jgi:hypothetical protein